MNDVYKDAGVDISAGEDLVRRIKPLAKETGIADIGGFGCLFRSFPEGEYMVCSTDGVGTKIALAMQADFAYDGLGVNDNQSFNALHGIGIDLVAMSANDVLTMGAQPLVFLDYMATNRLVPERAERLIRGIVEGCKQCGATLLGGETAEMPGMYSSDLLFDLAGFMVASVPVEQVIEDDADTLPGDVILGIGSSGVHSNGFSLVRKLIEEHNLDSDMIHSFLTPTRIYVKPVRELLLKTKVHVSAMAHITGGGLIGNLKRIIADDKSAVIRRNWQLPDTIAWLRTMVDETTMLNTFNDGIGFVVVVRHEDADEAQDVLGAYGDLVFKIGHIARRDVVGGPIRLL